MKFRIVQLHSASDVLTHGSGFCVTVQAQETLTLGTNEVGILLGKRTHHQQGAFFAGGILNPGWSGVPSIEMIVFGRLEVKKGDEVAHALIFQGVNIDGYTFRD